MRRLSNDVTLDSMLDSVQVEWSSSLASIISQFLHAVSRGRPSCISTPERTITEGTSGANLWGLVVSRINVQCSSINAYICNDLKGQFSVFCCAKILYYFWSNRPKMHLFHSPSVVNPVRETSDFINVYQPWPKLFNIMNEITNI